MSKNSSTSLTYVYCFIGNLPKYAIDTVRQLRLFTNGPVYFIVSDITDNTAKHLQDVYDVVLIQYDTVKNAQFSDLEAKYYSKFEIVPNLRDREKLFIRAFERFYCLHNLMMRYELTNVFFLELDNLVFDDPDTWLPKFKNHGMAYMFDNYNSCSSGICYVRSSSDLQLFLDVSTEFISTSNEFMSEMRALDITRQKYPDIIRILPTLWNDDRYPKTVSELYGEFGDSIFDSLCIGVFLGGLDPHHTRGVIIKGINSRSSIIDYSKYKYIWKRDEKDRNIPYILNGDKPVRINNLHVHSKDLLSCVSWLEHEEVLYAFTQ